MRFFGYVLRNILRNPVRTFLTIGSTTMCLFLMMFIFSFLDVNESVASTLNTHNRLVVMSSQGFAQPVPAARLGEIRAMDGVETTAAMSWYGGKYQNKPMLFAQFGVSPETFFGIYDELKVPADQLKAFQSERTACIIGRKLADEQHLKIGDDLPLTGDIYPIDLNLTVRGIYDGSATIDLRTCYFQWDYLNEELKAFTKNSKWSDKAGIVVVKCKTSSGMNDLTRRIDASFLNSDTPTRTQTEEAFNKMFLEMFGDLKGMIRWIGLAVVLSLTFVAGNAMAMAMRERTTEVAVLKAIGFRRGLVTGLVLAESVLVTALGGVCGALGAKLLFDVVDISRYAAGFLPFFFVPWPTALMGLGVSLVVGFLSGIVPAVRASRLSVVNGLRKVV